MTVYFAKGTAHITRRTLGVIFFILGILGASTSTRSFKDLASHSLINDPEVYYLIDFFVIFILFLSF